MWRLNLGLRKVSKYFFLGLSAFTLLGIIWAVVAETAESFETGKVDPFTYQVQRGPMHVCLEISGTIKSKNTYHVLPSITGMAEFLIPEYSFVKKGDVIGRIKDDNSSQKIQETGSQIRTTEAELFQEQTNLQVLLAQKQSRILQAQLDRKIALQEKQMQVYANQMQAHKKTMAYQLAVEKLQRLQSKWKYIDGLLKNNFITPSRRREEQLAMKQQAMKVAQAKNQADIFQKYICPLQLIEKENKLCNSRKKLEGIEHKIFKERRLLKANIQRYQAELKRMQKKLEKLKSDLQKLEIKAPIKGTVLLGNGKDNDWSRNFIKVGEYLWTDTPVFTIPDLSAFMIEAYVSAEDLKFLKKGMPVTIKIPAIDHPALKGKLAKISDIAAKRSYLASKRQFLVQIEFTHSPDNLNLRAGNSARIKIEVAKLSTL